jgi:hypothetical protein
MTPRILLVAVGLAGFAAAHPTFAQTPVAGTTGHSLFSVYCATWAVNGDACSPGAVVADVANVETRSVAVG